MRGYPKGSTKYTYSTLSEAKSACLVLEDCGGVTKQGHYETRRGKVFIEQLGPPHPRSWRRFTPGNYY